ncbi:MAG: DUF456 domain-containing protein [Phycisphaerales bacterium]|nr:DUF456 domain-containing protein [Phycisphaerales bacterium]
MDILLLTILILIAVVGVILAVLQLPGTWLIVAAAAGYDWYYDWQQFGWPWLAVLLFIAGLAELFEFMAGAVVARKAGASRRAAIGAMIGGFLGMFILSIPVPVFGTIVGGLLGCFLGALISELSLDKDLKTGARVGTFATIGRLIGLVAKSSAAMVIAGTTVSLAVYSFF